MKSIWNWIRSKFHWPHIDYDLSLRKDRWKFLLTLGILIVIGLGLAVGGVEGYTYSESVAFCGTVCHSMYPQLERHDQSPHAQVACTTCHVGEGAQAFIQSKIDGTRQLVSTVLDNYARPIKSPVHNLRPARETCEHCHNPTTFTDNIIKVNRHFDNDRANTPTETTLILKMGGVNTMTGESKGIHWHIQSEVSYIALDDQRQVIAWVGVKQADGTTKEFFSRDLIGMGQTGFVDKARANGELRTLDCIDCHNRTAHYIPYPEQSVDQAMANGLISADLPFIHRNAVDVLNTTFATKEEALAAIDGLRTNYADYPKAEVDKAIDALKNIYNITNFPDMNLDWKTNPNNERHNPTLGCFRCHDGNHVSRDENGNEEVISVKCNLCHTVPITGRGTDTIVEAPVIVGNVPDSHSDFRWTISHQTITDADKQACYNCHGQSFCNNGACHNLSHPTDMLFTHPQSYQESGSQVCFTCHQNVTCARCHAGGIINKP
jgi:nitrate/TMAO reductase-like tetraheme cytochrome c subunit